VPEKKFKINKKKELPRFMVSYNQGWRKQWDAFIIVVAIYSAFSIPFVIAFEYEGLWFSQFWWYVALDYITTLIYVADICINFRTTFLDNLGDERILCSEISANYIKSSRFFTDVFSLLSNPGTSLIKDDTTKMVLSFFGILKAVRVFRIRQMITQAVFTKDTKAMLNFVFLTFVLILYVHIVGCLWYLVVISDYCKQNLFMQQDCNPIFFLPKSRDSLTDA
jgi:hypothetical protein